MDKLLFAEKKLEGETEGRLAYYLLSEPVAFAAMDDYGIEVVLRRDGGEESARCRHITPLGSRITELLTALAEGCVTPCHLRDVVCDLLT